VSGKRFVFPANDQKFEAVSLECKENGPETLLARINGADYRIPCGHDEWQKGRLACAWREGRLVVGAPAEQPVAATGAWIADDTYAAKICCYETPAYATFKLQFSTNELLLDIEYNIAFGPAKQPQLVGHTE
jgi:hypothetical protein